MMLHLNKFFPLIKKQKGFTLIELIVALAITAIIGSALVMTTTQLFSVSSADNNRMEAVKQVENALHYINRDAQMAWISYITQDYGSSYPVSFNFSTNSLTLEWIDYTGVHTTSPSGNYNQVVYSLNANGDLQRTQTINNGTPTSIIVARHITSTSNYTFDGETFTINMTASVQGYQSATESRTLQVKPRVDQ